MAINPMQFEPTTVDNNSNVIMLNSPFYANLTSLLDFTHIRLKLWIWTTDLAQPYDDEDEPNLILYKEKVSSTDTHILFELADFIKDSFIPTFQYSNSTEPVIDDTVVFFKYEYDVINNPTNSSSIIISETVSSPTYLGTQGWLWEYEPMVNQLYLNDGSFGFYQSTLPAKNHNPKIKYYDMDYDFDATGLTATTIFTSGGTTNLVCPKEGWLIVYVNKEGRWDNFTPTGKVIITNNFTKEEYQKTYRNPLNFVNSRDHQVKQYNNYTSTKIAVNTGLISETQGQYIEEILYSPIVYLIEFKDELNINGYYNNWVTRPVIIKDSDFIRKTRLNDKNKISYNIIFETTTNKIKNIR